MRAEKRKRNKTGNRARGEKKKRREEGETEKGWERKERRREKKCCNSQQAGGGSTGERKGKRGREKEEKREKEGKGKREGVGRVTALQLYTPCTQRERRTPRKRNREPQDLSKNKNLRLDNRS